MKKTAILVLLVACGGGDDVEPMVDAAPVMCAAQQGVYRLDYAKQTGDCDPIESSLATFTPGNGQTPQVGIADADGCVYSARTTSSDGCDVTADRTCPAGDRPGWTFRRIVVTHSTADARVVTGTFAVTVKDDNGSVWCSSIYGLTATRQ